MISLIEILSRANREIPFFSHGERYILDILERDSYAEDGAQRRWELFVHVWHDVLAFLQTAYPSLGEQNLRICLEHIMGSLREEIDRFDARYECYRQLAFPEHV